MSQKAMIVTVGETGPDGLATLNEALSRGWRVARCTSMGGAGAGVPDAATLRFAALVIIERTDREEAAVAVKAAEEPEEDVDELLDEIVEGNGAETELTPGVPPSQN